MQCYIFHWIYSTCIKYLVCIKRDRFFLCSALVCSVFCTFKGKISLWSCLLCSAMVQGPLITDGRNSSKRTGHYVGWLKSCKWLKFLSKIFEKYFQMDNFIYRRDFRSFFCIRLLLHHKTFKIKSRVLVSSIP